MGELFRVPNYPDINLQDTTVMTADADSGQKEIEVLGTAGMSEDDLGILGAPGSLIGEIQQIDTLDESSITFVDDLVNNHRKTEPFTVLFGEKIRGYRALNTNNYPPSDADFSLFETGIDIDQDSAVTYVKDPTGSALYWYKFTYYNSISNVETSLGSSIPIRGGGLSHYVTIEDIRREAGLLQANQIQDTQIATRRDEAESEVRSSLVGGGYVLPLQDALGNNYVPPLIENIARMLAAGYVLLQDYGPVASGNTKDGDGKIKQAQALLAKLQDHTLTLVDINEQPMANRERVRGWPDDTTKNVGTDGVTPEPAFFTVSKIF